MCYSEERDSGGWPLPSFLLLWLATHTDMWHPGLTPFWCPKPTCLFFLNFPSFFSYHILLILFICGFCICKLTKFKLLKFIILKSIPWALLWPFKDMCRTAKNLSHWHAHSSWGQTGDSLPSCFSSSAINKCPFQHLSSATFLVFLCFFFFLVILQLKMSPKPM